MSSSASATPSRSHEPTPEVTVPSPDDTAEPPVSSPSPPAPPGSAPEAPPGVLTQDDDGRTFALAAGEEVRWQLDGAWTWEEPVTAGDGVVLTPVNYFDDPGYVEWLVGGAAPGISTVSVTGDPSCGDSTVCPPVTVRITFVVR